MFSSKHLMEITFHFLFWWERNQEQNQKSPPFSAASFRNTRSNFVSANTLLFKISSCLEYNKEKEESDSIICLCFQWLFLTLLLAKVPQLTNYPIMQNRRQHCSRRKAGLVYKVSSWCFMRWIANIQQTCCRFFPSFSPSSLSCQH